MPNRAALLPLILLAIVAQFFDARQICGQSLSRGYSVPLIDLADQKERQDIVNLREGQYRVRLMKNHKGGDCAYPGVEILPDGTIITTTYGHWTTGEAPYIVSVRLRLSELDEIAKSLTKQ